VDIKKIVAKLPAGFVEDAAGMDGNQLRSEIIRAETALREVEKEMKADEKLAGAKEILKDLSGSYSEAKRAQRAKIAYTLHLLDERGELGVGELDLESDAVTGSGTGARPGIAKSEKGAKAPKTRAA
jgi:hypothetical protein